MAKLSPFGPFRGLDANVNPVRLGKLYTYEAGTLTPKDTYTDASGLIANENPVNLDAEGYPDSGGLWLGSGAYKFILKDADGAEVWPVPLDNITGDAENTFGQDVVALDSNTVVTTVYENSLLVCTAALTLSLLSLDEADTGFVFSVRNDSAGLVTIDPDAAETINGNATLLLSPGQAIIVVSGPTGWFTIGGTYLSGVLVKTADYLVTLADRGKMIAVDATAAAVAITFPTTASAGDGFDVVIKKTDATTNAVTLDFAGAELGDGSATITLAAQNDSICLTSSGTAWQSSARHIATDPPFPSILTAFTDKVLSGLTLSNDAGDTTNDIAIAAGSCVSDDGTTLITLTAMTKRLDAAWAAGTGQGGRSSAAAITDTTYHIWAVSKPNGLAPDVLMDVSATAPTWPSGYTKKKCIGSIIRSGGAILAFSQKGSRFLLSTPLITGTANNPGISAVNRATGVPLGAKFIALLTVMAYTGVNNFGFYVSSPEHAAPAPQVPATSSLTAPVTVSATAGATVWVSGYAEVLTNVSAEVRTQISVSASGDRIGLITNGWIDLRL